MYFHPPLYHLLFLESCSWYIYPAASQSLVFTVRIHTCMQRTVLLSPFCLSVRLSNACFVTKTKASSEKSSIMINRKSITSFPMSLRWTAYVAPKPQGGGLKNAVTVFHVKLGFSWRKSATKFLCVKTFSSKVVRHSLAYLIVHKWLMGRSP